MRQKLQIGGMVPFTAVDYPNHLAAVIFCQGCCWRCSYCHNPTLQSFCQASSFTWEKILTFLDARKNILDAVVFSGGEPLLQPGILDAISCIKQRGFKVGLHTGGSQIPRLKQALTLIDWIGMDIKAPSLKYDQITGIKNSFGKIPEAIFHVIESKINYEFRTTVDPQILNFEDIWAIAIMLAQKKASTFVLQTLHRGDTTEPFHFSLKQIEALKSLFTHFLIRD